MASTRTATRNSPNAEAQMRGYLLSEDSQLALRDLGLALESVAELCEQRTDDVPELSAAMWGGLFRTFSRQAQAIHDGADFSNMALVRREA